MAFIQIVECRTDRYDDLAALDAEWRNATEFHESAMVNSDLPETAEFGRKQQELLAGPMTFSDLDVLDDRPE